MSCWENNSGSGKVVGSPRTQAAKKKPTKKPTKNIDGVTDAPGVPGGYKIGDVPPEMMGHLKHPIMQQHPHPVMNHGIRANVMHPVMVDHPHRPIIPDMSMYPSVQCWCNQLANDIHAIREMVGGISNGIHCILQKLHIDQVHNSEMMTKVFNTVEMTADTLNNLPFTQLQDCDQFLFEEVPISANSNETDTGYTNAYYGHDNDDDEEKESGLVTSSNHSLLNNARTYP